MHKFVCDLVENLCDNTRIFLRFQLLKDKPQSQCKLNCQRLSQKLLKNTRHPIVETSERFF